MAVRDLNNVKIFKVVTGELLMGEMTEEGPFNSVLLKIKQKKGELLDLKIDFVGGGVAEDFNPEINPCQIVWMVRPTQEMMDGYLEFRKMVAEEDPPENNNLIKLENNKKK